MLNCTRIVTAPSASQPKGFNMLNGLNDIDLTSPDAIDQINALAKGQSNKVTELLGKLDKAKGSLIAEDSAQEKLRILEANIERERLESKENYQGALTFKDQEYKANLDKLTSDSEDDKALIRKLLVDNGLSAELVKLGVNKDLMTLIQKGFATQATIVDGQAMIGEQSLSDFMSKWGETAQGKASRVAMSNSGPTAFFLEVLGAVFFVAEVGARLGALDFVVAFFTALPTRFAVFLTLLVALLATFFALLVAFFVARLAAFFARVAVLAAFFVARFTAFLARPVAVFAVFAARFTAFFVRPVLFFAGLEDPPSTFFAGVVFFAAIVTLLVVTGSH